MTPVDEAGCAGLAKLTGEPDPRAIEAAYAVRALDANSSSDIDRPNRAPDFGNMVAHPEPGARRNDPRAVRRKGAVTSVTPVQVSNDVAPGVTPGGRDAGTAVTALPKDTQRPCFRTFDEWITGRDGGKLRPGVWYFDNKAGRDGDTLTQQWVCSPLHIEAVTCDGQDNNFGRLLRFGTRWAAGASGPCRWSCCAAGATICAVSCWRWVWKSIRRAKICSAIPAIGYARNGACIAPCKSAGAAIRLCCRTL